MLELVVDATLPPGRYQLVAPVAAPSGVPPWMLTAFGELGQREIRGGENPRIMEYHRESGTGQDEDEDAWCGAFMGWNMKRAGFGLPKGPAAARSWLTFGRELTAPTWGCVVVFWRVSRESWQGHVGLFLAERDGQVWVLGGNQSDSVCVTSMPKSQVLGYRWPA